MLFEEFSTPCIMYGESVSAFLFMMGTSDQPLRQASLAARVLTDEPPSQRKALRILVAIASYGEKHLHYLGKIIESYRKMPFKVDIIVMSDAPKHVGEGVEIVVGLPSRNPWSLPFGHKAIFADRLERYDVFIYSEDDILVSEQNIRAFLAASGTLPSDEIPGFLLYERDPSGTLWFPGVYKHFHWVPTSAKRRGSYTVAEFTNDHSACYVLTQAHLRQAIASGGFLRGPCEDLYDLLCTAATDPYTNCGFRKVICISHIDDFLVHHTPDLYIKHHHVSLPMLKAQIRTLLDIQAGAHPGATLFEIKPKLLHFRWQKEYYEQPSDELLNLIPWRPGTLLSIGCGWGETEAKIKQNGVEVTALPLDSVIGSAAASRGIEIVDGNWDGAQRKLGGRTFDYILISNLLHLLERPREVLAQAVRFLKQGGTLVLSGPNFDRLPWRVQRILRVGEFGKLQSFASGGITPVGPRVLSEVLTRAGLRVARIKYSNHEITFRRKRIRPIEMGKFTGKDWMLSAAQQL